MFVLPIVTTSLVCALASPALALELGSLRMESTLGQPLRASIAYSLGANEQLYDFCIKLRPGSPGADVPPVSRATVALTRDAIILTGKTAVKDPLLAVELVVSCPYSPRIVRQYTLMIDPVLPATAGVPAGQMTAQPAAASPAPVRISTAAPAEPVVAPASRAPATGTLVPGDDYLVQSTDTASAIAARVQGRTVSLAVAVNELVAKNPHAFIDGDANRIMAAARVEIPSMRGGAAAPDSAAKASMDSATALPRDSRDAVPPVAALPEPAARDAVAALPASGVMKPATVLPEAAEIEPAETVPVAALPKPLETAPVAAVPKPLETTPVAAVPEPAGTMPAEAVAKVRAADMTADALATAPEVPSDSDVESPTAGTEQVLSADGASAETGIAGAATAEANTARAVGEDVAADASGDELKPGDIIAAAPLAAVTGAGSVRAQTPVVRTTARAPGTASSSSAWPMSRFVAGGAGILMLGLMVFFGRPLWSRFTSRPVNMPVPQPLEPEEEITQTNPVIGDVDFQFDAPIGQEPISLDADVEAGTGFGNAGEIDMAEDYGFTASGEQAKIDLDFDFDEDAGATHEPPPSAPPQEPVADLTPAATEEDYDVSMIIDATRQEIDDHDATAKDLRAVEVRTAAESGQYAISNDTLDTEIDLKILEQDYQDEFTATMAANAEIEKAAQELVQRMKEDQTVDVMLEDLAEGVTVEMPARETGDDDTAEITASIAFEFAGNDDLSEGDITARIQAAGSDVTVELPTKGNTDSKS